MLQKRCGAIQWGNCQDVPPLKPDAPWPMNASEISNKQEQKIWLNHRFWIAPDFVVMSHTLPASKCNLIDLIRLQHAC